MIGSWRPSITGKLVVTLHGKGIYGRSANWYGGVCWLPAEHVYVDQGGPPIAAGHA